MPISELLAAIRRRWLLAAIGVVLTAALTAAAYLTTKPTFEITSTMLVLPPASMVDAKSNPYLQLSGLQQTVDLVGVALSDQSTQLQMREVSKNASYTVKADAASSSPILVIDVKDATPESAAKVRDLLVSAVPQRLDSMQNQLNVTAKNRVTTTVLTSDEKAVEVGRQRLRSAVVAAGFGLLLTLVGVALYDARRQRRVGAGAVRARRSEEPAGATTS